MRKKLLNACLLAMMMVTSTTAWALSQVDGVYQIGTAEDLKAFADLVNGGDSYACAVLTADIDYGIESTMIGMDMPALLEALEVVNGFLGVFNVIQSAHSL